MSIPPSPSSDTFHGCIAEGNALLLPDKSDRNVLQKLPLPGVVIFVHGVNSDGEWYEATERGLCAGLNTRLARKKEQLTYPGPEGGQLTPNDYLAELTDNGFLNPDRNASNFVTDRPAWSPVLRFRWGFKADKKSLAKVGRNVWLNESNYWGGGPFANGCSALPDLWGEGVDPRLFLWLTAQDLNPEPGREVYTCPPRHYYALAAWRLAELVALIRKKQADLPITIVCHSQGNMIGLAAAFYGDKIGNVTDPCGKSAPAIADAYVLANAPYSLEEKVPTDNWAQRNNENAHGQRGRVTAEARFKTLQNFVELIATRRDTDQDLTTVVRLSENRCPRDGSKGYKVEEDRKNWGRHGRVTVYCNPHDRVISALTVQGIGWRGLSADELREIDPKGSPKAPSGTLVQRVWADGHAVGMPPGEEYTYGPTQGFWNPPSRLAKYSLTRAWDASRGFIARLLSLLSAPVLYVVFFTVEQLDKMVKDGIAPRINADPPPDWRVPVNAPKTPEPHPPHAERLGQTTPRFDQGADPDTDRLRATSEMDESDLEDDPYAALRRETPDAPPHEETPEEADRRREARRADEAQLKYEHRARLRMHDRRNGGNGEKAGADNTEGKTSAWTPWGREHAAAFLKESIDQHATDHSTIMCCALNAEKVLAYDIPVGVATKLTSTDWNELRVAADWQLWKDLKEENPLKRFGQYFKSGLWEDQPLHEHPDFNTHANPSAIPAGIVDERSMRPVQEISHDYR